MALDTSLTAYYSFSNGDLTADSIAGSLLTNNNSVGSNASGKLGYCADGGSNNTNKSLTSDGNSPAGISYSQFATAWSISCWINPTTNSADDCFTGIQVQSGSSQRRNLYLFNNNGTLQVRVYDGTGNSYNTSQSLSTSTWYHVVMTYDGTNIRVYANNSLVLTQARTFSAQGDSQSGGLGILAERQNGSSGNYFSGLVDELGVWSKVLNTTEIGQLYNSGNALSPVELTTRINAYWKLDESSGNASDSVGSVTLTNNNTVAYATGKINNGADMGSSNSSKNLTSSNDLGINGGYISISAWIKPSSYPSSDSDPTTPSRFNIFGQSDTTSGISYFLHVSNVSGTIKCIFSRWRNSVAIAVAEYTYTPPTSSWTHLVGTYDGNTVRIYVNSNAPGSVSQTGGGSGGPDGTAIGSNNSNGAYFSGMIDEVSVWNRALIASEVAVLYNSGNGLQYPFITAVTFAISETLALVESISNLRTRLFSTSETLTLTETISVLKGIAFSIAEALGLVETFTSTRTRLFTVAESMGLIEIGITLRSKWNAITKSATATMDNVSKSVSTWINTIKS
jgi:hypothetical protein